MDNKTENKNTSKGSLKFFFIKLFSISIAIILIINFLFNMILSDRLDGIDKILSIGDTNTRFEIRDQIRGEIEKGLGKENLISEQDKILLFKLYIKIKEEFDSLDKSKL
tara:strand:+ start:262 stop:588 length:327 start_codon:yes stop_codon:yes gene_type:complete